MNSERECVHLYARIYLQVLCSGSDCAVDGRGLQPALSGPSRTTPEDLSNRRLLHGSYTDIRFVECDFEK
jgi:hypothetical protein